MSVSPVPKDPVVVAPVVNLANANLVPYQSTLANLARVLKNVNCTVLSRKITDLFISPANTTGQVDPQTAEIASQLSQKFLQVQRVFLTQAISYLSSSTAKINLQSGQIIPATSDDKLKTALRVLGIPTYKNKFTDQIITNLVEALSHPGKRSAITVDLPSNSQTLKNLRTHLLVEATLDFRDAVIDLANQDFNQFAFRTSHKYTRRQ